MQSNRGYGKVFASMFDGSLRGKPDPQLVMTFLIASCTRDGVVDIHWKAISDATGLPLHRVKKAIQYLESPDPESRSPDEQGKRIIRLDAHRDWGWRLVNHAKYRSLEQQIDSDRRAKERERQQRHRAKLKNTPSPHLFPKQSTDTEAYAEAGVTLCHVTPLRDASLEEVLKELPIHVRETVPEDFVRVVFSDWDKRDGRDAAGVIVRFPKYVQHRWANGEGAQWRAGCHTAQKRLATIPEHKREPDLAGIARNEAALAEQKAKLHQLNTARFARGRNQSSANAPA